MNTPTLFSDLHAAHDWLAGRGLLPPERRSETLPTPHVRLHDGSTVVSFCSNNYLGLNHRPEVKAAATQALHEHTHATSESRRLGGNLGLLEQLEYELAEFKKQPSALITATGLLANIAAVHGILDAGELARRWYGSPAPRSRPVVIYDELCHRSIQMGARESSAERVRFRHNDADHLADILAARRGHAILVVTEGVFSMDGDLADLPRLVEICDAHGAVLMVDDAHGTGVYGADGSGTANHFGLTGRIPLKLPPSARPSGAWAEPFWVMNGRSQCSVPSARATASPRVCRQSRRQRPSQPCASFEANREYARPSGPTCVGSELALPVWASTRPATVP